MLRQQSLQSTGVSLSLRKFSGLPVAGGSTELSVVFDLWLSAAGPHGSHASVGERKGDHLTGSRRGKNLGEEGGNKG